MIGIDIGNTLTKVYDLTTHPPTLLYTVPTGKTIDNIESKHILISSVNKPALDKWLTTYPHAIVITRDMPWSFRIAPDVNLSTVGIDRLLAINGISIPSALVVMLGTATVINVVIDKTFIGGAIAPGVEAMHEGLTLKAPGLKKFAPKQGFIIGKTSEEAIYSGIYYMQSLWIDRYNNLAGNLPIVYTGGAYLKLQPILPRGTYIPHLIALGMQKLHSYL
ncbi:MAG: type III pantothenate kinase [Dictyoglomi bacterium]|nr:type III pantothenate kinase [Dictyoglomota bacterium]